MIAAHDLYGLWGTNSPTINAGLVMGSPSTLLPEQRCATMPSANGKLERNQRSQRGNLSLIVAGSVIPLAVLVAAGTELASLSSERALMQAAVDAAALAGAQNLTVAGSSQRQSTDEIERFALAQVTEFATRATITFTATQGNDGTYTVEGLAIRPSFFGDLVPPGGFRIEVTAVAEAMQAQPICVIGDDASLNGTAISGSHSSTIVAPNCIIHANSNFVLTQSATVQAGNPRATGLALGAGFMPDAQVGAMRLADPFRTRTIRPPVPCDTVPDGGSETVASGTRVLSPGMHRTDLTISGTATLTLQQGEHYFCKPLRLSGQGRLEGEDVLMMFMPGAALNASQNSYVSLSGRQSGDWAGFVIVATRGNYANTNIGSSNVDRLLGTIYLPMSRLVVSAPGNVAETSQWSVVVARNVNLSQQARLTINSDYEGSPVPVPLGVGNRAGGTDVPLRLRR